MLRSSIGARFASVGAATLLCAGLFAQAAPTFAASPSAGHALPPRWSNGDAVVRQGSRGTIDVGALLAHPKARLPFDPAASGASIAAMEAKARIAARTVAPASGVGPQVVGPPLPDPVTDSGAPAPTTPVAVAGQTEGSSDTLEPANPGIAVGPDEIIQSDNISFRFADRAGTTASSVTMPFFFGLPEQPTVPFTTFDTDPEVHFDTLRQRWIASELSWDCATNTYPNDTATFGHGYIDYAISDTADPQGTWSFDYYGWEDLLPDRPEFGTSTDKFALTANFFALGAGGSSSTPGCASGGLQHSEVIVSDWAQLGPKFDPSKIVPRYFGSTLPDLRLAVQEPVTSPDLRLVYAITGTTPTDVEYVDLAGSAVHNTVTVGAYDLTADNVIPEFLVPPSPHQPGSGTLTTAIDGDPDSVIYHAGTLAFASNYPCTPSADTMTRNCVRVVTLANANAAAEPTRLGDTLLGSNGFDDSFGGIAWSGSGVLHAVYSQSSATSDASSYEQYNLPSDAPTAWSAPQLLTAGAATYSGSLWGAYTIVASDPQDPTAVWVGDPYVNGSGTWSTTIHELVVGGAGAGYFPLTPVRVLDSRFGTGLAGVFTANVPRTFPVAGTHGIPANAVAITGDLTVTGQTAAGYLALTPTPTASPATSTINFPLGDDRGNNVTIALASDGSLSAVYKASAGKHTNLVLDVTGYFLAGGEDYFPLSPVRILDSRLHQGATTFVANVPKTFAVRSVATIPSDATAITANLAVINQSRPGYVALTPTVQLNPPTSTINFPVHDTRANGLTVPIGPDGTIAAVYKASSGTIDLILDVTGYYSALGGGLLFHPLNPGRRVDTRLPLGVDGLGNGLTGAQGMTPRSVAIINHFGVPAGASAITGNLTITGQTAGGWVSLNNSVAVPTTATINFPLADNRANGITVPLGSGNLWFVYEPVPGKAVQVIVDITGYFQ